MMKRTKKRIQKNIKICLLALLLSNSHVDFAVSDSVSLAPTFAEINANFENLKKQATDAAIKFSSPNGPTAFGNAGHSSCVLKTTPTNQNRSGKCSLKNNASLTFLIDDFGQAQFDDSVYSGTFGANCTIISGSAVVVSAHLSSVKLNCFLYNKPITYTCTASSGKCETNVALQTASQKTNANDPCSYSRNLADRKKYNCDLIKSVNEAANMGNQIAQQAGAMLVSQAGNASISDLANNGKISESYRATAKVANVAATQQAAIGASNTALAVYQLTLRNKYKSNLRTIQNEKSRISGVDPNAPYTLSGELAPGGKPTSYASASEAIQYLNKIEVEQQMALTQANAGIMKSSALAVTAGGNAIVSKKIARDQNDYANKMDDIANQQQALLELSQVQVTPAAVATFAPYTYNNTTNVNNGTTDNNGGTSSGDEPALGGPSGIQGPAVDGAVPNEVAALPYSAMKAAGGDGGKPAAAGGGGGGGGGAAGGSPALGQEDRAGGSTLVMNGKNENYDSIGKSKNGAGGAAGATTNAGGGDGLDLNSMLAKFLPGAGGGEEEANNGILDYAKREPSRAPANEAPAEDMILDRGADLFQRVSATYRDKLEKKEVGI